MHHCYDVNVSTMLILLARVYRLAVGALLLVLPNSEPYNKLFTTTEDGHLMAETRTVYQ
jgi:hypothetical protein